MKEQPLVRLLFIFKRVKANVIGPFHLIFISLFTLFNKNFWQYLANFLFKILIQKKDALV